MISSLRIVILALAISYLASSTSGADETPMPKCKLTEKILDTLKTAKVGDAVLDTKVLEDLKLLKDLEFPKDTFEKLIDVLDGNDMIKGKVAPFKTLIVAAATVVIKPPETVVDIAKGKGKVFVISTNLTSNPGAVLQDVTFVKQGTTTFLRGNVPTTAQGILPPWDKNAGTTDCMIRLEIITQIVPYPDVAAAMKALGLSK
jgi:hypothetical protein